MLEMNLEVIDEVRLLVREEGKAARNIVAFSVPLDGTSLHDGGNKSSFRKPPIPKSPLIKSEDKIPKLLSVLKKSGPRIRSASAGRDRKSDLQARYWGLLFENLRRAVDEIYQTCESDESIEECKEAIMILEACTKDFHNLIEWLKLKWNYEQTPPPQRPTSLAWEVRKMSPTKPSCAMFISKSQRIPFGFARRQLTFDDQSKSSQSHVTEIQVDVLQEKITDCATQTVETELVPTIKPTGKTIPKIIVPATTKGTTPRVSPVPSRQIVSLKPSNDVKQPLRKANELRRSVPSRNVSKPKIVSSPGKAGKNAMNTEVKSQSWAQKIGTSAQVQVKSNQTTPLPIPTETKSHQSTKKTELSRSKSNLVKSNHVSTISNETTPTVQRVNAAMQEEGWETVRGRTRSRTSPGKNWPPKIPPLTRASTIVYTSRSETKGKIKTQSDNFSSNHRTKSAKSKPLSAQSLPSLSLRTLEKYDIPHEERVPAIGKDSGTASFDQEDVVVGSCSEENISTTSIQHQQGDITEEVSPASPTIKGDPQPLTEGCDRLVEEEEEAEMARREEALTIEEENLQREMRETEKSDNETEEWEDPINVTPASSPEIDPANADNEEGAVLERDVLEEKYEFLLQNCSWADRMEFLDQLEDVAALDVRQPGRALQVHEKLSSPSRRRLAKPSETFQQHEAKQLRAQQHRAALQEEKARKRRDLAKRIEEVRAAKAQLLEQKRLLLERKMKLAEEKRQKHLADIVKKAHDEEEKLKEIAFINELEAQNKRHDFIAHIQTQEERIQGMQEERQRRQEERKLAKEAAVEERKRALAAERQAKMAQLQEKRRQREERIDREHQVKEKERLELAREKQRDREERLSALQAAHQASLKGLQRKIQQKQEESARRHEENMEQIRQKALELSILRFSSAGDEAPRLVNYETARTCTLCNATINSEVILMSHLRGRTHIEALKTHFGGREPSREQSETSNLLFIVDAPGVANEKAKEKENGKEKRQKVAKKRAKKIRQKLSQYPESTVPNKSVMESPTKQKIIKIVKELERDKRSNSLDRQWNELNRLFEKGSTNEQFVFSCNNGFSIITKQLQNCLENHNALPARVIVFVLNCLRLAVRSNASLSIYVISTKMAVLLLDILHNRLQSMENSKNAASNSGSVGVTIYPPPDNVATTLMDAWITILDTVSTSKDPILKDKEFNQHVMNLINYAVCLGIVDRLAFHIGGVRGPLDNTVSTMDFLLNSLKFLSSLISGLHSCQSDVDGIKYGKNKMKNTDSQLLTEALQVTEAAGTVNALYGLLLHQGVPSRGQTPPSQLPDNVTIFTKTALQLLYHWALFDRRAFQVTVGAEGVSLEFRHIVSYLLWYSVHWPSALHLLHLAIICTGYFAAHHHDNQMILQTGHMPSVLQQLCRLPFSYFSEKPLRAILFPTLLACCHENQSNRTILEKEMSYQMLEEFTSSEECREIHLVDIVLHGSS